MGGVDYSNREKAKRRIIEACADDIVTLEDGYRYFWASKGAMSADNLRVLADHLDSLNKKWNNIMQNDPAISPVARLLAFDCFGTVFDMSDIPRAEIAAYVNHVNKNDFMPYEFPASWYDLKAHPDSAEGIKKLQDIGFSCVTLSNGDADLLLHISKMNGINWDRIIDLAAHKVYKPHIDAYRTVEIETGYDPARCVMITANPTFGDIEGAKAIGMQSKVIRNGYPNTILELAELLW